MCVGGLGVGGIAQHLQHTSPSGNTVQKRQSMMSLQKKRADEKDKYRMDALVHLRDGTGMYVHVRHISWEYI